MTDRAVDHDVTDAGDDAAEHARVDDDLHFDVLAGRPVQRLAQPLGLLRRRARSRCAPRRPLAGAPPPPARRTGRRSRAARPAAAGRRRRTTASATLRLQRLARRAGPRPPRPAARPGRLAVAERHAQLVVRPRRSRAKRNSSSSTSREVSFGAGDFEHGIGVRLDASSSTARSVAPYLVDVVLDERGSGCRGRGCARRPSRPARSTARRPDPGGRPSHARSRDGCPPRRGRGARRSRPRSRRCAPGAPARPRGVPPR